MAKSKRDKNKIKYSDPKKVIDSHDENSVSSWFKMPEGFRPFIFKTGKKGKNKIDVMPFIVGEHNPYADPGTAHYERTVKIHRFIGTEGKSYACLANFDKPCPICEKGAALRQAGEEYDVTKKFKPSERQLFIFKDKEAEKGEQNCIYEGPFSNGFGELLKNKLDAADDDSPYLAFHSLEDGMTLTVKAVDEPYAFGGKSGTFIKPTNIEMIPRAKPYAEEVLDKMPCLDEIIIQMKYKTLKKIVNAAPEDSEDEDDEPKKKKKRSKEDDEDDDEIEDEEDDSDEEDEEGDSDEDEEDDEEDEKPSKKKKKSRDSDEDDEEDEDSDDDDDSDDEEDEEDEDEKPKKKSKKKKTDDDDEDD